MEFDWIAPKMGLRFAQKGLMAGSAGVKLGPGCMQFSSYFRYMNREKVVNIRARPLTRLSRTRRQRRESVRPPFHPGYYLPSIPHRYVFRAKKNDLAQYGNKMVFDDLLKSQSSLDFRKGIHIPWVHKLRNVCRWLCHACGTTT